MSDVGLNLDGLIALLAVLAAGGVLLLGFVACVILGWVRSRRAKVAIRSQPIYRHLIGILVCVIVCSGVGLAIFLHDRQPPPRPLEAWLDRWVPLWLPAIFVLWPISAAKVKKWQTRPKPGPTAGTDNREPLQRPGSPASTVDPAASR